MWSNERRRARKSGAGSFTYLLSDLIFFLTLLIFFELNPFCLLSPRFIMWQIKSDMFIDLYRWLHLRGYILTLLIFFELNPFCMLSTRFKMWHIKSDIFIDLWRWLHLRGYFHFRPIFKTNAWNHYPTTLLHSSGCLFFYNNESVFSPCFLQPIFWTWFFFRVTHRPLFSKGE